MATFEVPEKAFEDITVPDPLPIATYGLRMTKPAALERNKKENGYNIVIDLETFGEPDPEHNGRPFTIWLSMPSSESDDFNRKTRRGGSIAEFKMQQIEKTVKALGGSVEGHNFNIPDDSMCKASIGQEPNPEDPSDIWNSINGPLMPYEM
jgi:hypothetical protein